MLMKIILIKQLLSAHNEDYVKYGGFVLKFIGRCSGLNANYQG